jgi:hypothetical protein
MSENNPAPETPAAEARDSSSLTNLIGIAIIVCGAVIVFFVYTIHRRDCLSAQADSWARGFIRSSPVVERQLGHVQNIKRINESLLSGNLPGWYLDYDVSGRRGQGTVAMQMNTTRYGDWDVPSAELEETHRKPINLR